MADELEDLLNEEGAEDSGDSEVKEDEQKSKESLKRIRQQADKISVLVKEKEEREKRIADLEFNNSFKDQMIKYPYAKDHEADIKENVAKGISVEDATILVLTKNKKLVSPEEIRTQKEREKSLGGSADITHVSGEQKSSKDMSQSERLEALREAEARGDIGTR